MSNDKIIEFFHTGFISIPEFNHFMTEHHLKGHDHRVVHQTISPCCDMLTSSMMSDRLTLSPLPTISVSNGTHNLGSTLVQSSCALRLAYKYATFWLNPTMMASGGMDFDARYMSRQRDSGFGSGYGVPNAPGYQEPEHVWLHKDITKVLYENIGVTEKEYKNKIQNQNQQYFTVFEALNLGSRGIIDGIVTRQLDVYRYEILMRNDVTKIVDLQADDFAETLNLTAAAVLNPALAEVNKK